MCFARLGVVIRSRERNWQTFMFKSKKNFLLVAAGSVAALSSYWFMIRPWHLRWGATEEELKESPLGDDLVQHPTLNATHAITIMRQ